ncbi:MAG: hypothetical protein VB144_11655 [Clostridia bacterium]|nr:hypothetical protein [Clostridia bacterium]
MNELKADIKLRRIYDLIPELEDFMEETGCPIEQPGAPRTLIGCATCYGADCLAHPAARALRAMLGFDEE